MLAKVLAPVSSSSHGAPRAQTGTSQSIYGSDYDLFELIVAIPVWLMCYHQSEV